MSGRLGCLLYNNVVKHVLRGVTLLNWCGMYSRNMLFCRIRSIDQLLKMAVSYQYFGEQMTHNLMR